MASIITGCHSGDIQAEPVLVVSPREDTPAVHRAEALGVKVVVLSPKAPAYAAQLVAVMEHYGVDLVCLAGYLSLLPGQVVDKFRHRILNIHPALLPKFGGKGMFGIHVHEAVLASGDTESGCTVHYVTEHYDEGEILVQKRCPVLPGDTTEALAQRVLDLEHSAYREALQTVIARTAHQPV